MPDSQESNPYKTKIETDTDSLMVHYPQARVFQDQQQKGFWTANEVALEKDIQPILTETTEAERHGILTVLKLFTLYELRADEFWSTHVRDMFPRPEIHEMAALFGAMELSVHRRVYDKLNNLLYLSNDEFYRSYQQSPTLKQRMDFLDDYLKPGRDSLIRVAAFSFAEGVVLFSSFAFLMSFRANGSNKLPNVGAAVKFSARDEDLHAQASAWLFRTLETERKNLGQDTLTIHSEIYKIAEAVRLHEYEILDEVFSKGKFDNINLAQMKAFVDSRIDHTLDRLGLLKVYNVQVNPVAEWFNKITESYSYVDFFATAGASYSRGWNAKAFTWIEGN